MSANVYVDGFNLYYCAVKNTRYKWLNLLALTNNLFPGKTINRIRYFSARVKATLHDPSAPTRQQIFLRALKTIPTLEITEGNFVRWPKTMPQFPLAYLNNDISRPPNKVQVEYTNEKGSDVNLAAYLLYDNCNRDADESIIVSNDSDLTHAIELVTNKLNRTVIIVNPNTTRRVQKYPKNCSMQKELRRVATKCILSINEKILASSQFSSTLTDHEGTFTKPETW